MRNAASRAVMMSIGFCERDGPSSEVGDGGGALLAGAPSELAGGIGVATVALGLGSGALATAGALSVESDGPGAGGGRVPHAARTLASARFRNGAAGARR